MNTRTWKMSVGFIAVVAMVLAAALPASAATMVTTNATVACSNTDLLQTSLASVGGLLYYNTSWGGGEPLLRDGIALYDTASHGSPNWNNASANQGVGVNDNAWVVYTLDTTDNTLGYDLTEINVFHGWANKGRDTSNFSVSYSTVGAPDTFTTLYANASYDPTGAYGETSIVVGAGEATGVKKIRFDFGQQQNGFVGYSEIDVVGTATVIPEPATMALLAIGGLGMLVRRRRHG